MNEVTIKFALHKLTVYVTFAFLLFIEHCDLAEVILPLIR